MAIIGGTKRKISGEIVRIEISKYHETYLWIKQIWDTPYLCKGNENLRNKVHMGDHLALYGNWKRGPDTEYHHEGSFFEFKRYVILTSPSPLIIPTVNDEHQSEIESISEQRPSKEILSFLREIGEQQIYYTFNESSANNTIAQHVKYQLMERVVKASATEKDLYFLTAFFDASALDSQVQSFRKEKPNFKEILIKFWQEADVMLTTATHDIPKYSGKNFEFENSALQDLCNAAPGRLKRKYLLICFKIVDDIYKRSPQKSILDTVKNYTDERILRDYLIKNIWGVDYKLANWTLTNVTGHWFVIDKHIIKVIDKHLRKTTGLIQASAKNADQIFRKWFGNFNEEEKYYSNISQEQFVNTFPDFLPNECEYLPFIVTQYLWFYGKFIMTKDSTTKITNTEPLKQINQIDNICKIETGLLAPVKELYLEQPERDIYSLNDKASFGHDKKKELIGLQQNVEDNSIVNTTDHSNLISKEKWFVVHAWELYNINKYLIGFRDPSEWRPIKKDHIVFYYRTSPAKQIMGIYKVVNCREGIDKNFKITKENGKREYLPYQNALELIDPFQCNFDSSDREHLSFYHALNKSRTWGKQQVFKMSMRDVELIMNL
ncbi:MAG: hypothetical protein PHW12_03865 [Smithella sp.]|nr:hypothetical protein [Smithella sp.]